MCQQCSMVYLNPVFMDEELKKYIDSHSHPVPDPVFDLYRFALEQAGEKVTSVFVERDQNFPTEDGWREEIRRVRQIAEEVYDVAPNLS